MPHYDILGITVRFPYEAYDCQLKLMESVIASLKAASFFFKYVHPKYI